MAILNVKQLARRLGLGRIARGYRQTINTVTRRSIHGVTLKIPRIRGLTCLDSEPWMLDLLVAALPAHPGVFLDVGVNLGQTLLKVKALEPQREYVGFEPNPACVFYVEALIRENAWEGCLVLPVGLHTTDEVLSLDLYAEDETDASASLVAGFRPDHPVVARRPVPVFRYNQVEGHLGGRKIGLVKIDVEGAELEVVESLRDMIRRDRPAILIEVLPVYSAENHARKIRQEKLEAILAEDGYSLYRVTKTPAGTYAGLTSIERIGIHSDLAQCDYVAVPGEGRAWAEEACR